ncbi:hypothetical protein [Flavivirga jejuensis]|uniref:Uncharacterized protein n=1 Tax=Flavivirga jejuensis TaxID=870487 RepID=A0ABT8WJ64_9FLAO|nr:hypothetical protein [Flavivirga jejuensis]MDO5973200.1 hypothetical protein [Flavivirga jejuensis]
MHTQDDQLNLSGISGLLNLTEIIRIKGWSQQKQKVLINKMVKI